MKERVTFDVFATDFVDEMYAGFQRYLHQAEMCQSPEELLALHEQFVEFTVTIYSELVEVADSATTNYH